MIPWNWRKIIAIAAIVLALILAGGAVLGIYGGPSIRKWRAVQLSEKAEKLFAAKEYMEAQKAAVAAYQLDPGGHDVQRTVGKILARIGHPQAIDLFRALYEEGAATDEDHLFYAQLLLQNGNPGESETITRGLLEKKPDNVDAHILHSKVLLIRGDLGGSGAELRRALALDAANAEAQVLLGRLLALSPDAMQHDEGVKILQTLAKGKDQAGLDALKYLLRTPQTDPARTREWIVELKGHPLSDEDAQLLVADWEIRLDPESADSVYARLVTEYRLSGEHLKEFAGWLNQHAQYHRVLELLPMQTAMGRRDYFLIWLDAKAGLGEWTDVEKALDSSRPPLEKPLIALFRGRALEALGQPPVADRYYHRAIADAAKDPRMLWYLAGYFQQLQKPRFADSALRKLVENPTTARMGYQALLALALQRKDTEAIAALLTEMRQRWPKDEAVENDQIYFSLLLGRELNQEKEIRRLAEAEPESLPVRSTLALLLLKNSRTKEALDLYKDLRVDWLKMNPGLRAVYAAVLEANGLYGEARIMAKSIPANTLRKEEEALIAPIPGRGTN